MDVVDSNLEMPWIYYESYFVNDKKEYRSNTVEVAEFSTVEELLFFLSETSYSTITSMFTNIIDDDKVRIFAKPDIGEPCVIDSVSIFRKGIRPEWEHPSNQRGGELQFEILAVHYAKFDALYRDLLLEMCGAHKSVTRCVNGIRILDKLRSSSPKSIRVDLWLDFDPHDKRFFEFKYQLLDIVNEIFTENEINADLKQISHSR